jgi:cytochrome c-type biogenesis protein CcmF
MSVYAQINLFFLLILAKLSPFALLPAAQPDGLGLNPLLRDPWMVVHPPLVFIGYSMAGLPFSIAMAALIKNDFSSWLKRVLPWVAITALMLAAGNILGGFWAYKTLGWGGYWAWDPVENSSFIPWLISLALLHGLLIERRTGALRRVNLLLTSFVFLLVVYGTFLTRSGVLADFSVHSFTDLGINIYLIGFMILFILMTVVIFLMRAGSMKTVSLYYNYYGKEFSLFAGMVLLFLVGTVVLFWTSLPFITTYLTDEPRAADIVTYNNFALPLSVLMAFFLATSPFVTYAGYRLSNWGTKLIGVMVGSLAVGFGLFYFGLGSSLVFAVIVSVFLTGMAMYLFRPELRRAVIPSLGAFVAMLAVCIVLEIENYLYLLFWATAAMAVVSNSIVIIRQARISWKTTGGLVTHFGFGLMLIGILSSSAYDSSQKLIIDRGGSHDAYGVGVGYDGMAHNLDYPNNEVLLSLKEGENSIEARPQLYYSERMNGIMRKPFIRRSFTQDLYFAPEQVQQLTEQKGLKLGKGETKRVGDIDLTFSGYLMGQHDQAGDAGVNVQAKIDVMQDGEVIRIMPSITQIQDGSGTSRIVDEPAKLMSAGAEYAVSIGQILADEGAVILHIPGLLNKGPVDRLILDITRKPLINLVWTGAVLIMLGTIIVYYRRQSELTAGETSR